MYKRIFCFSDLINYCENEYKPTVNKNKSALEIGKLSIEILAFKTIE